MELLCEAGGKQVESANEGFDNVMTQSGITTERIKLNVGGSTPMEAYVARRASGGLQAGLMVFQEAYGVNLHNRNVADRFAEQG